LLISSAVDQPGPSAPAHGESTEEKIVRILVRASAIALATTSILLGGAVAAQAAPSAAAFTITVNRLVFQPQEHGHTGSIRVAVRNNSATRYDGVIAITEPVAYTLDNIEGGSGCSNSLTEDGRTTVHCGSPGITPGETAFLTATFRSPAAPQAYARIAPAAGSVEVDGVAAGYPALFRATTGSLRNPVPYVQDTAQALTVAVGDVTLTRQQDGSLAGRVPVTVRNDSDAPHRYVWNELVTPAGIGEWAYAEESDYCGADSDLPVPPGGSVNGCALPGGSLAEGEKRTLTWLLTALPGTPLGELGTATVRARLADPNGSQSSPTNIGTFTITVTE
jgi:hypothetical protein